MKKNNERAVCFILYKLQNFIAQLMDVQCSQLARKILESLCGQPRCQNFCQLTCRRNICCLLEEGLVYFYMFSHRSEPNYGFDVAESNLIGTSYLIPSSPSMVFMNNSSHSLQAIKYDFYSWLESIVPVLRLLVLVWRS